MSIELRGRFENQEHTEKEPRIILRLFLMRHGPKLSAVGEKNEKAPHFKSAVEQGFDDFDITEGVGLVHISSSPVERAKDSAAIGLNKISATNRRLKQDVKLHPDLASEFLSENPGVRFKHDLEVFTELQKKFEAQLRGGGSESYADMSEEEREVALRNQIDTQVLSILFDEEKAKSVGLQTSYEEMADALAQRYEGFLRHASLLESHQENGGLQPDNEPYVQIDVSHSFPIMSFLKKYLVFEDGVAAKDLTPEEFFEITGGVIGETKALEMDYIKSGDEYLLILEAEFFPGKKFKGTINFNKE